MLGAIIGDIVGSRWEFNPTNDYDFEWLSAANGYTDDTICTVAVADALLHHSDDYGTFLHEWCRRYPHPMGGYGGRFGQWVASDHPQPYDSFGNGAAMRVSPVAYWYDKVEDVLDAAAATALPTHNHAEGVKGAQTVALAIFRALQYNRHSYQEAANHIDEIIRECVAFSGYDINIPKSAVLNRFDETCQGTVPVALKIISVATDYVDAVRLAVSLGADADTLGAIVGSIAEAIWGIPYEISRKIEDYLSDELGSFVRRYWIKCPYPMKCLIDSTFYKKDFSEAARDLLDDEERTELRSLVDEDKNQQRLMMAERGKARLDW